MSTSIPKERAGKCRSHAVLTRAGFGNDAGLSHAAGKKRLTEHLIGFVGAAVNEVFALQINHGVGAFGETAHTGERRRAARIVAEQIIEFGGKRRVFLRVNKGGFELVERRNQDFRNELTAVLAEIRIEKHEGHL